MFSLLISLATILGIFFYRAGLPPLIGFLFAGFIFNFFGYKPPEGLEFFSEMGISLLLFFIGLKVNFKNLLRKEIFLTVFITTTINTLFIFVFLLFVVGFFFDQLSSSTTTFLIISLALSFSSTVFTVKLLDGRGDLTALYGTLSISILIIQDVIAGILMLLTENKLPGFNFFWIFILLPLRHVFYKLLDIIGHDELLIIFGLFLALVVGVGLFNFIGIKGELGALLVGLLVSKHPKSDELAKALFSIKEFLLVGFFISIGINGNLSIDGLVLGFLLVLLLPLRLFSYFFSFTILKFRSRTSLFSSLSLMSYSEFALIVVMIYVSNNLIASDWLFVISVAISFSFLVSSPFNKFAETIYEKYREYFLLFQSKKLQNDDSLINVDNAKVLIIGMGRIGTGAYDELKPTFGDKILGIEQNKISVENHIKNGRNVLIGDANDADLWRILKNTKVEIIVLAMPEHNSNLDAAIQIKKIKLSCKILAVARFDEEVKDLDDLGVTAFNIYSEAGVGLAKHSQKLY